MTMFKHLLRFSIIFDLLINTNAYIPLYNTEDASAIQSYDCIYYVNVTARNNETVPYCVRTTEDVELKRPFTTNSCENSGKEWNFRSLKQMNILQDEVLTWNSSIEMADRYAAYLITKDEQLANDIICNCSSKTFGKFCEYEFMTKESFDDTVQYQFDLKLKYRQGSQLWGNITCYTTLTNCNFGLRCLTWQNICDGKQHCMDGVDEDHCEELELNECEENEYRCEDGSCIPEQYWLDGEYDCSDKSDEQNLKKYFPILFFCSMTSYQVICDETTQHQGKFACGDGQFQWDTKFIPDQCYNYRNIMFFCELGSNDHMGNSMTLWTLENGHCVEKGQVEKNLTDMDETEQCLFYLKCKLTNSIIIGCDDVIQRFHSICQSETIIYPTKPVLQPYVQSMYYLSELDPINGPNLLFFNGSIKCIGYQAHSSSQDISFAWNDFMFIEDARLDHHFCQNAEEKLEFGPQFDKHCWNDTKASFFCQEGHQCISKHRLRNGINDCKYDEDEHDNQRCFIKTKHRFRCSEDSSLCLPASRMGDSWNDCSTSDDEYIIQLKWILVDHQCTTANSIECSILKNYIQSSASLLSRANNTVLLFRHYCDTIWHLPEGFDESFCKQWKCPKDQYQCLSGHCTPLMIIHPLMTENFDWNCPDASDDIGLFGITKFSEHNAQLVSGSYLERLKQEIIAGTKDMSAYFSNKFCDINREYNCILANVNDPLNFIINRPCINLTQIGDNIIDCYGGLDERNLLTCGNHTHQQRGFDFHCNDVECIPYHLLCVKRCSNKADSVLCDQLPALWNPSCSYPTKHIDICEYVGPSGCYIFETKRYYCDLQRTEATGITPATPYRCRSWAMRKVTINLPEYPTLNETVPDHDVQSIQTKRNSNDPPISSESEDNGREGWICGRGVAIQRRNTDEIQCFCPPSLYGEYCQYFSDRIIVITSVDNIPTELLEQETSAIKILAVLFSNDDYIIDQHVFHLPLVFSRELNKKFRFNLISHRPKLSTDLYKVRFEAYHLNINSSIKFLAVWQYSIEFPFLPSYRLVQILKFEETHTSTNQTHICQKSNPCLHNSTCHSIQNKINHTSVYYCHCNHQTFGKHCQYLRSSVESSLCSKYALLRPLSSLKSICLCPIHLYGPTCHLNHTCVNENPCVTNRGQCLTHSNPIGRDYICVCDKKFFGDRCQYDSALVRINFTDVFFVQTPANFIMSSIIQLCDLHDDTLDLIIRTKQVYQGLPPSITEIYYQNHYLPRIGIVKLYHKLDLSNDYVANLKQSDYFLLYSFSSDIARIDLTSVINLNNYCPYTPTIFGQNLSNASHLFQFSISNQINITNRSDARVIIFQYHLLCNTSYSLMCFHDENYFCICDMNHRAECSLYNSRLDECNERCRTNGQCIRGNLNDRKDFLCLCPRCYYGSVCQHNTELFSFTLETLLTNDLYSSSIVVQNLFFNLLIIVPLILFLIGTINNILCYVTFDRAKPLLVGVGHYLRTVSIINQLALFALFLKFLHLVLSMKGYIVHHLLNTVLCKVLSYFLVCTSRMSYWLMAMIAIERVYVTWYLKGTWLKSPRIAKCIIATIIIGIAIFDVHELIYYESIEDPKSLDANNSTWCVTSYPSAIGTYNQINVILNYILPLLINLFSTIILIFLITQKRAAATAKKTDHLTPQGSVKMTFQCYVNLLMKNKELILAPSITMLPQLFALPQFILSFSLACQEFSVNWQRYLLIITFFLTYLPQLLLYKIYISPSSFYREEYQSTKLNKKISQWRAIITRR